MAAVIETTREQLVASSDWAEAFGEGGGGNTDGTVSAAMPKSKVSLAPVKRADVVRVIASVDGENDGPDWLGLFKLRDGRFAVVTAGCDYTGWDCQAQNSIQVAATKEEAIRFALGDAERARLGLKLTD